MTIRTPGPTPSITCVPNLNWRRRLAPQAKREALGQYSYNVDFAPFWTHFDASITQRSAGMNQRHLLLIPMFLLIFGPKIQRLDRCRLDHVDGGRTGAFLVSQYSAYSARRQTPNGDLGNRVLRCCSPMPSDTI